MNLSHGDYRNTRWCEIVKAYKLESMEIKDGKIKEMLIDSSENKPLTSKARAIAFLKNNNGI